MLLPPWAPCDHAFQQGVMQFLKCVTFDLTYVVAFLEVPFPMSSVRGNVVKILDVEVLLSSKDSNILGNQRLTALPFGTPATSRRFAVAIDTEVCQLQDKLCAFLSKTR